jgi:hypothetical protein
MFIFPKNTILIDLRSDLVFWDERAFLRSIFLLSVAILLYFPSASLQDNPKGFPRQSGLNQNRLALLALLPIFIKNLACSFPKEETSPVG